MENFGHEKSKQGFIEAVQEQATRTEQNEQAQIMTAELENNQEMELGD